MQKLENNAEIEKYLEVNPKPINYRKGYSRKIKKGFGSIKQESQ
jgi:hypothetical protein